jgi:flagellar hook-associated protein 2
MPLQIDGISTGIDTTALIAAISAAAAAPRTALLERIEDYEAKQDKIAGLVSLIGDMEDALDDIADIGDFRSFAATYAENDSFSASVDGDAVAGSYDIEVNSLAKAEMEISQGYASKSTEGDLGTGTMAVTYAGSTTNVTLTSDMTMSEVAAEVDDIDGLTAYVMDTGDASTPYRLVIQGDDEGSANTVSVDTSGLSGGTAPSFTESVSASDAEVTVNGITITADSNTVTDAVPGLTLDLTEVTTSAITVTVAADPEAIEAKVQTFVDAYNAVLSYVDVNSVFDSDEGIRGPFVGETSVKRVVNGLRSVLGEEFSDLGQDYDALSLVGISTNSDDELEIDSDLFQDLLNDEPDQIADLFTGADGFIEAMIAKVDVYTDSTDGSLAIRQDTLEARIDDMEDQVDVYDRRLDRMNARLRSQFTAMETLVGTMNGTGQYLTALLTQTTG